MEYNPTDWKTGDVITEEKLNNIEQGIMNVVSFIPDPPSEDGEYELKCSVEDQSLVFWEEIVQPVDTNFLTFSSEAPFTLGVWVDDEWRKPSWDGTLEYSTDAKKWTQWDGSVAITSGSDNKIYLRGTENTTFAPWDDEEEYSPWCTNFDIQGESSVACSGSIETLLDYATVARGEHPVMDAGCFSCLFNECSSLTTAPELPATTLAAGCYIEMFSGCASLSNTPELPAMTLIKLCYEGMFTGCTSLTSAPSLPATTLAEGCYVAMFDGCTALLSAPELPATTLAERCYADMFIGCTSLTSAPELHATTLVDFCYGHMFDGCTSLVTSPALPATTLSISCYNGMFHNCTSLTTPPALPATVLTSFCYGGMFGGCTSLIAAPALPATTLAERCYESMFYGCTSLSFVTELPATTLVEECYLSMFYGCTSLKLSGDQTAEYTTPYRIPSEGTGVDATNALTNMFAETGGTFTGTPEINTTYYMAVMQPTPDSCLTFSSNAPFTLGTKYGVSNKDGVLEYSTDAENWYEWNGSNIQSINNSVYLRGTGNTTFHADYEVDPVQFKITTAENYGVRCFGNIETLLDYATVERGEHPTMGSDCFSKMFYDCVSLLRAPSLPATTLAVGCYDSMFSGCTSLTTSPELPATTLASFCYTHMFYGCTSLTTAPALPATTLADSCYESMFNGCTSLVNAPELPATTMKSGCYQAMFADCTSLTAAPALPAMTLASSCYNSMFVNCTSLTAALELPATTLTYHCYENIFSGCTSIRLSRTQEGIYTEPYRIPSSGTGVESTGSLQNMFVRTGGTFTGTPQINTTYYMHVTNT